jgi:hypothetical protein
MKNLVLETRLVSIFSGGSRREKKEVSDWQQF